MDCVLCTSIITQRLSCACKTNFACIPLCSILCGSFAGLAGSVLEERLNRTNAPHWYCATEVDDWQTVWLSLQSASRPDCLLDELQVFYDDSTGRCAAQYGLSVKCLKSEATTAEQICRSAKR